MTTSSGASRGELQAIDGPGCCRDCWGGGEDAKAEPPRCERHEVGFPWMAEQPCDLGLAEQGEISCA
ncbi:hypothetical protein NDU88_002793 [Pleurodeles waltl]|uniref:Uncharacterized protein n=1 Tax=Pleurodeles waltl TaxID=8319 RepID=A0AAV7T3E5_PLEWA|nr:hypothetical protein NDU88_002793 [Pleurodeles waltl]